MTETKRNIIRDMPGGYRTLRITAVRIWHQVSHCDAQSSQLLLKFPGELHSGLYCCKPWVSYKSNLVASWMHLHNCRCCQAHLTMLLQSLRALYTAPGRPGRIWMYIGVIVRLSRVHGRFACGFQTNLHHAHEAECPVNNHRERIGLYEVCFTDNSSLERGSWGVQQWFDKELNSKSPQLQLTHRPWIEWSWKGIHIPFMCTIPSHTYIQTGYSSCCVAADIISYPLYDLYSHETVGRCAAIQDPSIPIGVYNNERNDEFD